MWDYVSIVRTKTGLKTCQTELQKLQPELVRYQATTIDFYETKNLLQTALLITQAALQRTKSVGCHYVEEVVLAEPELV